MIDGRRLMMGAGVSGGSSAQVIQGSFSGNGTAKSPDIPCSFYPDIAIVYVDADSTIDVAYVGARYIVIYNDRFSCGVTDYSNTTRTSQPLYSSDKMANANFSGLNENGTSREERGHWDGTNFYIDTASNNEYGRFAIGYTYNYTIIKL